MRRRWEQPGIAAPCIASASESLNPCSFLQVLATCSIVVDVGGVYDHEAKRYDHHQVMLLLLLLLLLLPLP